MLPTPGYHPTVLAADLSGSTVSDIRQLLRKCHMATSGRRAELVARLARFVASREQRQNQPRSLHADMQSCCDDAPTT